MSEGINQFKGLIPGVSVRISDDSLSAEMRVDPASAPKEVPVRDLRLVIAAAGVTNGVIDSAIEEASVRRGEWIEVARGTPPEEPRDGTIEFLFDISHKPKLEEDASGKVDLKELGLIENVVKGQLLARRHPPKPGRQGLDVRGVPMETRDPATPIILVGKNVSLSADGNEARAENEGMVVFKNGAISVETVYTVMGDVGPATGNIDFVGTVAVGGSILDGFTVTAVEDIIVRGNVESARLRSGGEIRIEGGVVGRGGGEVRAKGNINIRHAQDANLVAVGDVVVKENLLRTDIISGGRVIVRGRGSVAGGRIRAAGGLWARQAGTEGEIRTLIEAGTSFRILTILDDLERKFIGLRRKLIETKRERLPLDEARASGRRLEPDRLARLDALIEEEEGILPKLILLSAEAWRLASELPRSSEGSIRLDEKVHPGTILAGPINFALIREEKGGVKLAVSNGKLTKEER